MSTSTKSFIENSLYLIEPNAIDLKKMDKFIRDYLFHYGIRGFESLLSLVDVNKLHPSTIEQIEISSRLYTNFAMFLPGFLRRAKNAIRRKQERSTNQNDIGTAS